MLSSGKPAAAERYTKVLVGRQRKLQLFIYELVRGEYIEGDLGAATKVLLAY